MANKTLDILVAEMLGDVGKLNDQVVSLKMELPKILDQMHSVIAAQTAKAEVLQEPVQRAMQHFVRQELRGIKVAANEAKIEVLSEFEMEAVAAIRKNLIWIESKSNQTFDVATKQFNNALTESAKVAETRATETLKSLCQGLKNGIDEIRAERWQRQYLSMFGACLSAGVVVGVLAVFILK